jgi:hypothetical protein
MKRRQILLVAMEPMKIPIPIVIALVVDVVLLIGVERVSVVLLTRRERVTDAVNPATCG